MVMYGYNQPNNKGVRMKKINTLFTKNSIDVINSFSESRMNSKSEISRAALCIGLTMIGSAMISMTDRELRNYILDCQDIDDNLDPTTIGDRDE